MSNPTYKGGAGWHWCLSHQSYMWATANTICPYCQQVVTIVEGGQQAQGGAYQQGATMAGHYYQPQSSHYPAPVVPSNAPVSPTYYSAQPVTAQQYAYQTTQATSSAASGAASQGASGKQAAGSRWVCDLCPAGQSVFSREPDLTRHKRTVHGKDQLLNEGSGYDCPHEGCDRKGKRAFTRHDHWIEHRRGYHKENIKKRGDKDS